MIRAAVFAGLVWVAVAASDMWDRWVTRRQPEVVALVADSENREKE